MSDAWEMAGAIIAVGVIAALVCEAVKLLVPFRRWFHRSELEKWLGSAYYEKLLDLLGGVREVDPVLQQPTSRLMGGVQTVAAAVLEHPAKHLELFTFLTQTKEEPGVSAPLPLTRMEKESETAFQWRSFATKRDASNLPAAELSEAAAFACRDVLDRLVERKLDAFQARCETGWALRNRMAAAVVGLILATAIILVTKTAAEYTLATRQIAVISTVCVSVLAEEIIRSAFESRGR